MSVYNGEKYLNEAIKSILNQTYDKFEFLIINDGSNDSSKNIIEYYAKKDKRIRVVDNLKNKGLIYSLNLGIELAKGKYIVRMDSDDISSLDRIEKQYQFIKKNEDTMIVGTGAEIFVDEKNTKSKKVLYKTTSEIKVGLLFNNVITHPSVIMNKEKLKKYNLKYNSENLGCEDYGLWVKAIRNLKIVNMKENLLRYRIVETGVTQTLNSKIEKKYNQLYKIYEFLLKELFEEIDEEKIKLHFEITNNILNLSFSLDEVERHLENILQQNLKHKIYNQAELKKELGKRWILLGKNTKNLKNKNYYFNKYMIFGIKYILKKWKELI